jgi:hypothetical protein
LQLMLKRYHHHPVQIHTSDVVNSVEEMIIKAREIINTKS